MNVELLRKIAQVIQERPQEFDMSWWHSKTECGTAHCIGGWAVVLSGLPECGFGGPSMRKLLGVTWEQGSSLFYTEDWPKPFQTKHDRAKTPKTRAKIAAARINHFIQTEGRE